ncbi:MAG: radical SAM family heme chaperone HemW [Bryobacteraceae bacterium]
MPGVYISYPFCAQKCSFCNFASGVSPMETRARYERVLLDEMRRHEWKWIPETVYLGGGTPSLMRLELLGELMRMIPRQGLPEVTIECAPGSFKRETARAWPQAGVNRVSLGVQSFVTAELRSTGRRHTAATVVRDIEMLREAGIQNINIDLIAGLPEQTTASWECSLHWIERLQPTHVSVYIFEVDEDSRLGEEILSGGGRYGAKNLPSDDMTAGFYETAVERLASLGLARYEISNFAREGWESRHNLKYWHLEPYIGFGLDAHSFDGKRRWSNPDTLDAYVAQNGAAMGSELRAASDHFEEHFFVGLRLTSGIEPQPEEWLRFAQPIEKWLEAGMLERSGSRLRLSDRGVLISNEIFQDFIQ